MLSDTGNDGVQLPSPLDTSCLSAWVVARLPVNTLGVVMR
jgi:hypothetical protein